MFRGSHAKVGRNLVVVWALEKPCSHSDGRRDPSTVVYIEKASESIRRRWTERALANLDIRQIQELLGHKRIATTTLYTKVDMRGLSAMIQRCHPRERV